MYSNICAVALGIFMFENNNLWEGSLTKF